MVKNIMKILPNGETSGLSLNSFKIFCSQNKTWNGKCGEEIYSSLKIKSEIMKCYKGLGEEEDFYKIITENYKNDIQIKKIIDDFIDGFSCLIFSIIEANSECKENNVNLSEADWSFWKKCKNVLLDGKMMNEDLGDYIVSALNSNAKKYSYNVQFFNVKFFYAKTTTSLLGCANEIENKQYVFDFGSTYVKRGYAIKNEKIEIKELEPIKRVEFKSDHTPEENAKCVNEFIIEVIEKTIADVKNEENINISFCISNNIINDTFSERGKYGALKIFGSNYKDYLKKILEKKIGKNINININIYNDAEAVARVFYGHEKFSKETAVVTLGTHFGIGYPK